MEAGLGTGCSAGQGLLHGILNTKLRGFTCRAVEIMITVTCIAIRMDVIFPHAL